VEREMAKNRSGEKRTPLVPPERMSDFVISLLLTGVPMLVLVAAIIVTAGSGGASLWWLSLAVCVLVMIICAGFAIAGKQKIAQGILLGIAIGVIGLVVSCATVLR
jgi:hypothetical protein